METRWVCFDTSNSNGGYHNYAWIYPTYAEAKARYKKHTRNKLAGLSKPVQYEIKDTVFPYDQKAFYSGECGSSIIPQVIFVGSRNEDCPYYKVSLRPMPTLKCMVLIPSSVSMKRSKADQKNRKRIIMLYETLRRVFTLTAV